MSSQPVSPKEGRTHEDNFVLNEIKEIEYDWKDVFNRQISKGTTSEVSIAGHYPANSETLRVFVDGTRQFLEYDTVSQYNHNGSAHELSPAGGETVVMETTERPRYTVQYEMGASWALGINQSLNSGDRILFGLYNGSDGWYAEKKASHATDEIDLVVERDNDEKIRKTVTFPNPLDNFSRFFLRTAWYDVTRQRWEQSYSENGEQKNPLLGKIGEKDTRGPLVGNLPLRFEVEAASGTSGLVLEAGSCALVTYGGISNTFREKDYDFTSTISTAGSWVPIHALRVDPDREIINTQLTKIAISEFTGDGDVDVLPIAVSPSKTDASSFSTPEEQSSRNSVIESTSSVTSFPDNTGNVVSSASNPGGYQVAFSEWEAVGNGSNTTVSREQSSTRSEVSARDVCIVLANAEVTGDISCQVNTLQEW